MKNKSPHARFWALLKKTEGYNENYKDVIKEGWVMRFSKDRTESLSDLQENHPKAYEAMMAELKRNVNDYSKECLKAARSAALKQIQLAGIDTTKWSDVDHFIRAYHIADKDFYYLTADELEGMMKQLRVIARKAQTKKQDIFRQAMWN